MGIRATSARMLAGRALVDSQGESCRSPFLPLATFPAQPAEPGIHQTQRPLFSVSDRLTRPILSLLVSATCCAISTAATPRTWSPKTAEVPFEAELLFATAKEVLLRKTPGRELRVLQRDSLTNSDERYIASFLAKQSESPELSPPSRMWRDKTGSKGVDGNLVHAEFQQVVLQKQVDGMLYLLPLDALSNTDQNYIRTQRWFPVDYEEDFGHLLQWLSTSAAQERNAFVQHAESAQNKTSEAQTQLQFIRCFLEESAEDNQNIIKQYAAISRQNTSPRHYAAQAAFRCAELRERDDDSRAATGWLAAARRLSASGSIWVENDKKWARQPAFAATEKAFLRMNGTHLSYRLTVLFSNMSRCHGLCRFLLSLTVLFVAIRVLMLPLYIRAIPDYDRWTAGRPYHGKPIAVWYIMEIATMYWIGLSANTWQFVFGLDEIPFLWMPSLTTFDVLLAIVGLTAIVLFWVVLTRADRSRASCLWWLFFWALAVTACLYSRPQAWRGLFDLAQGLTGVGIVVCCRLVCYRKGKDGWKYE